MHPILLVPLLCGVGYSLGGLYVKRAGSGIIPTLFWSNVALIPAFLPLVFFVDVMPDWSNWAWPMLASLAFFGGQVFFFSAVNAGDVSVQAPVMGAKVVIVAVLTLLLGAGEISSKLWIAAALTTTALFMLAAGRLQRFFEHWKVVVLTLCAATCYSTCDVLFQRESQAFGPMAFAIIVFVMQGVYALLLAKFVWRREQIDIQKPSVKWMAIGIFFLTIQTVALYIALTFYGRATEANIMYSGRGVWTVLLVWFAGSWFGNTEGQIAGNWVMARRLFGALLLFSAITMVVTGV